MNRYTNMSTKEIVRVFAKLSASKMTQELAQLSSDQQQQVATFMDAQLAKQKHTPGQELLALVGGGILFLVMWVGFARLAG